MAIHRVSGTDAGFLYGETPSWHMHVSAVLILDPSSGDQPFTFHHLRDQIEFQAHSRGYLGPFAQEPATSWAAPHLTGIAARILSLRPDLKPLELKAVLYWMFRAAAAT